MAGDLSQIDITYYTEELFSPANLIDPVARRELAETALEELTCFYAEKVKEIDPTFLEFDYIGLEEMLARFTRDAYGVHALNQTLEHLLRKGCMSEDARRIVFQQTRQQLGIRINSPNPRKTRIAAAFSLWMATFRPVFVRIAGNPAHDKKRLRRFTAELNLWIVTNYLSAFGNVSFGNDPEECDIRIDHIIHDFTYRQLSLSTLELLYCSLFSKLPPSTS
jgi:hypothetical protein